MTLRVSAACIGVSLSVSMVVTGCAESSTSSEGTSKTSRSASASPATVTESPKPKRLVITTKPWRLPFPVAREAVIGIDARTVLVAGGMLSDESSTARAYRLDLVTGQAVPVASLPIPVHDVAGGRFDGDPAVFGGGNASEQSAIQRFSSGSWRVVGHLPTTRSDLSVAEVDKTSYVVGGYDGSGQPRDVMAQSNGSLRVAGRLLTGVRYSATVVVGSAIYLFGGEAGGSQLDIVQRIDVGTGKTTEVARLPAALGHASAALLNGRVLLMGGRTSTGAGTAATWWFDPGTARFSRGPELPKPITDAAIVTSSDGSTAWLIGGEDPRVRDSVVEMSLS